MSLADLDRQIVVKHFDKWGADVHYRPMSAGDFSAIESTMQAINGQASNTAEAVEFWCELLSLCCVDPQYSKEEWKSATIDTLHKLGTWALEVCGLLPDPKKN